MKRVLRTVVIVCCIGGILSGCATKTGTGALAGAGTGAVVGGIIGGILGGRTGAALGLAIGAAVGGGVGTLIGSRLDARDKARREAALKHSISSGAPTRWRNPDTGNSGTITPISTPGSPSNCRDLEETYLRQGTPTTEKTRYCAQPDGTWQIQTL